MLFWGDVTCECVCACTPEVYISGMDVIRGVLHVALFHVSGRTKAEQSSTSACIHMFTYAAPDAQHLQNVQNVFDILA